MMMGFGKASPHEWSLAMKCAMDIIKAQVLDDDETAVAARQLAYKLDGYKVSICCAQATSMLLTAMATEDNEGFLADPLRWARLTEEMEAWMFTNIAAQPPVGWREFARFLKGAIKRVLM